ncbi:hypothetical protein BC351_00195 [Paenibacillus ferrarius]|uniref:Zinc-ribbon domain-containing protein n=1 Tax=Paenibacillus ferrarius TaxID=1469647 RepID=A0A1V4HS28_9BACL|nr:zinc ribbon domain-containing protein [Paenibacillus ferrarius]OPH61697.1 hypothetical protein BC351_00195 [Paenibacillus ferrarius]
MTCKKCNAVLQEDSSFCSNCGAQISSENGELIAATSQNAPEGQPIRKLSPTVSRLLTVSIIIIVVAVSTLAYFNYFTKEAKAKLTVNRYLSAIKNGQSTYSYRSIDVDDFINVIDYKYLSKTDEDYVERITHYNFDKKWYDQFEKQRYSNFQDFIKHQREFFASSAFNNSTFKSKTISDTSESLKIDVTKKVLSFQLMYDVQVTNQLGQLSYRKAKFTVDEVDTDKFEIHDYDTN